MGDYKLVYFQVRGRAEPIRLTFAAAGKKFEDVRLADTDWASEKANAPYGSLPYLVYKGKTYGESAAIAAFVAKECGLAGKCAVDEMKCTEVFCLVSTLLETLGKPMFEKDEDKKAELLKKAEEKIPEMLGFFEKMLKESGSGYIVGSSLTQADLSVYDITCTLLKQNAKVLDSFPEIQKMRKNVEGNANVKAYLDSAPDCPF